MPENVGNKAYTTAQSIAAQNGFTNGSNGVTITTAAGRLPNQLKVTSAQYLGDQDAIAAAAAAVADQSRA